MTFCARPSPRPVNWRGLLVHVEVEPGERKRGVGADGRAWENIYTHAYGEVAGTEGADQDPVDVYLGPDEQAPYVFVVRQLTREGAYDEDKCLLGFSSADEAAAVYRRHGPPWGFGSLGAYTWSDFVQKYLRPRPPRALFDGAAERAQLGQQRYGTK